MKYLASLVLALAFARATPIERDDGCPQGIDVSSYQPNITWNDVVNNGIKFAYVKATEGTYYVSPEFKSQYTGAAEAGVIRGSYHFARPDKTTGAVQAKYFLEHGASWTPDGITLPGALDIEYNPYGPNECYGVSVDDMVAWIMDFSNTYNSLTGRYPVIYTTTGWWTSCTGNSPAFGKNNPLWIAHYASAVGTLPAGWDYYSFWQYADKGPNPGDADLWNGNYGQLKRFARGG